MVPLELLLGFLSLCLSAGTSVAYAEAMTISAVPEPGTVLLMGIGLAAIGLFHKQGTRIRKAVQRWLRARLQR